MGHRFCRGRAQFQDPVDGVVAVRAGSSPRGMESIRRTFPEPEQTKDAELRRQCACRRGMGATAVSADRPGPAFRGWLSKSLRGACEPCEVRGTCRLLLLRPAQF